MTSSSAPAGATTGRQQPARPADSATRAKLTFIALLYFSSGFPYALVNELAPTYLRMQGVEVSVIGHILGWSSWAWILKPAWAPLVDRYGSRRGWIIACQLLLAATCATMLFHSGAPTALIITITLFALATFSATQDIAADAFSIELLDERERGPANGVRVTAARLAFIAAGGLLVALAGRTSWRVAWGSAAIVMLLLAVATVFAPSPRRAAAALASAPAAAASWLAPMRRLLARRGVWAVLLFIVLFKLGDYALVAMIKPFWVDAGYSAGQIGLIQGTVGMIATIAGALAGGAIVPRLGTYRALLVLGVAQALASVTYWFVALAGAPLPLMWGASIVEHFTNGLGTAAFLTFLMGVCERRFAATQYAMLTALFGLSRFLGQFAAGDAVEAMGYSTFFLLTFALAVPAWLLLPLVRRAESAEGETS